jgi:RNA polymerase sigma-70 factor (sigma-E family)
VQRHGTRPRLPVVHEMASAAAAGGVGSAYGVHGAYRPGYGALGGPVRAVGGTGGGRPGLVARPALRPVVTEGGAAAEPVSDELDFEEYVTARGAALVRLARGLLRDPQHAEDLVQDVLVRAHQRWAAIRRTSNPDGYVYRMIVNASTSFWRRAARRELVMETDRLPAADVSDASEQHGDRELMLTLLRRLPAKQRAVLVLRHYEGLTDAEIADLLGTSTVTVRSNAHRGLATMRKLMSQLEGEEVRRRA